MSNALLMTFNVAVMFITPYITKVLEHDVVVFRVEFFLLVMLKQSQWWSLKSGLYLFGSIICAGTFRPLCQIHFEIPWLMECGAFRHRMCSVNFIAISPLHIFITSVLLLPFGTILNIAEIQ